MLVVQGYCKTEIIRLALPDVLLDVVEPRTDSQSCLMQFLFVDVDVKLLFQRVGEGGCKLPLI